MRRAGAVLISVMDYTKDSAIGDLVATVLDGVNEYQSRASGADIAYKMGQKVTRGGSLGVAPIGYLNVREKFDGREVRTVVVDPARGPLVRMAFEDGPGNDDGATQTGDAVAPRVPSHRRSGHSPRKRRTAPPGSGGAVRRMG